jgi:hypothetical protein
MEAFINKLKSIVNMIKSVAQNIDVMVGAFIGMKAAFGVFKMVQALMMKTAVTSAIAGGAAGGAATGPAAPIMIPLLIAGTIGAVLAALATTVIPSFHNLSTGKMAEATKPDSLVNIKKGEAVANVVDINSPEPIQPTLAPNFGRESAMQKSFGLTDADASRIGKAIGGVLSSNLRLKSTVENRTQRLIIEGATNQIGGKDIVMA